MRITDKHVEEAYYRIPAAASADNPLMPPGWYVYYTSDMFHKVKHGPYKTRHLAIRVAELFIWPITDGYCKIGRET